MHPALLGLLLLSLHAASAADATTPQPLAAAPDCSDACECGTTFPLQLLGYERGQGSFYACPAALSYFKSLGSRVLSIASIIGNARIGKSFLVNNLLGRPQRGPSSFVVGHGGIGVTKGMWLAPFSDDEGDAEAAAAAAAGSGAALPPLRLILDVEGFEAVTGTEANFAEANDPKLAMLASTMSASLLYVVYHTINQHNIHFLHATAQLDEILQKKANASFAAAPITWILQGPPPELSDLPSKGFPATADGYLSSALHTLDRSQDGRAWSDESSQGKLNAIIRYIKKRWRMGEAGGDGGSAPPLQRMFILGTPSASVDGASYPELLPAAYSPSYAAGLAALRAQVRAAARAKASAGGQTLTGSYLAHFLPSLIELVNSVEQVGDELLDSIAEGLKGECAEGLESALAAIKDALPLPLLALGARLAAANESLLECFDGGIAGRAPQALVHRRFRQSRRDLLAQLQRTAGALSDANAAAAANACGSARERLVDDLTGIVDAGSAAEAFFDAAAAARASFSASCSEAAAFGDAPVRATVRRQLVDARARFDADLARLATAVRYRAFDHAALQLAAAAFGAMVLVYFGVPVPALARGLALLALAPYLVILLRARALRASAGWIDASLHARLAAGLDAAHEALFAAYVALAHIAAEAAPRARALVAALEARASDLAAATAPAAAVIDAAAGPVARAAAAALLEAHAALLGLAAAALAAQSADGLSALLAGPAAWSAPRMACAAVLLLALYPLGAYLAIRALCCCLAIVCSCCCGRSSNARNGSCCSAKRS